MVVAVARVGTDDPTMDQPRRDTIDPMVPELPTEPLVADGGSGSVAPAADPVTDDDAEAPLVPHLS